MRKTSQDGGDSTSITSGLEIEFKKSGYLKSKRNSVKKKAQILSNATHDNDESVIEPLLQKDNEKMGTENQSAKYLSSKSKTDFTRDISNETENLLVDKKVDKPNISDISEITRVSYVESVKERSTGKSNDMVPIHNHMHSNVFNLTGAKESVVPKSQILIEIDANKQSVYNPSPLIFTMAKIHIDGNSRHMDPVHVTPIPILSTTEGCILKSESGREPNGSVNYKNDNNLNKTYAKPGANTAECVSTPCCGESSLTKNNVICSSELATTTSNVKKCLADSRSDINTRNCASREENRMDMNKNIEIANIDSSDLESNLPRSNKYVSDVPITVTKTIKVPGENPQQSNSQISTDTKLSNNCGNFSVSSVNSNTNKITANVPDVITLTSTPYFSVSSSISTLSSKEIDTDLSSSIITPMSSVKTTASKNIASSNIFNKTPTNFTIISNNSDNDLSRTTKNTQISTVKSNESVTKPISTSDVANFKKSLPLTKPISSTCTIPCQIKAKSITVSNTVTVPSYNQTNIIDSLSNTKSSTDKKNQKFNSLSSGTKTGTVSVIMPHSLAKTITGSVKPMSTSNKTPKDIISKSKISSTATTCATSNGIKAASKANATTTAPLATGKTLSSASTSKESSVSSKLTTNKTPVATNTEITRTTTSSVTAISSSESSVSRKNKTPVATNTAVNRTVTSSGTAVPSFESTVTSKLETNKTPVAINTTIARTNKSSAASVPSLDSSVSRKPVTNKTQVARNTEVTRTNSSSTAAVPSDGTDTKLSLANKQSNQNNDRSNYGKH